MELIELHLETVTLADEVDRVELRAGGRRPARRAAGRIVRRPLADRPASARAAGEPPQQPAGLRTGAARRAAREPGAGARGAMDAGDGKEEETRRQGDKETRRKARRSQSPCLPVSLSPCLPPSAAALSRAAADRSDLRRAGRAAAIRLAREAAASGSCAHVGPERIETLWWRGPSVRRDYYRIATESGSQLWIFRRLADGQLVSARDLR